MGISGVIGGGEGSEVMGSKVKGHGGERSGVVGSRVNGVIGVKGKGYGGVVMGMNGNQWKCGAEWGQRSRDQRSGVTGVRRAGGSRVNGGHRGQRERLWGGGVVMGLNGNQWKCEVEWGQKSWGQRSEVTKVRSTGGSRVNGGQRGQRERLQDKGW